MFRSRTNTNPHRKATLTKGVRSGNLAIKVRFPYSSRDVDKIRSLTGRKYFPDGKYWVVPMTEENLDALKEWHFVIDPAIEDHFKDIKTHVDDVQEIAVPGLGGELYPFQSKGVAFIEKKNGRALIADEQGLGKTIQALGYLQLHPDLRPVVVVVPASVKLNWEREAKKWVKNCLPHVISGKENYGLPEANMYIINYDILDAWLDTLREKEPKVLIIDEIHYTKNSKAKRTKAVKMLAKRVDHLIALSGTPAKSRPVELFNAIKMIDPTVVPTYWEYVTKFCAAKHTPFGWDVNGSSNEEELHERLTGTIMLRRLKKEVLPELPDKIYSFVPMEMDAPDEYWQAEDDFIQFVRENKGRKAAERASNAKALAEIEVLRQLSVKKKLDNCIRWIEDFLKTQDKLVVFATHKFVITELMSHFGGKAVKVDGSVTGTQRQEAVDRFQNELQIKLFVGNIKAAGVGITLTASSNVVFLELPWTPADLVQAEDRCHRIGQENAVNVYYLLADNTIEERIAKLIDKKRKVLDAVLDGEVTEQASMLSELMKDYDE